MLKAIRQSIRFRSRLAGLCVICGAAVLAPCVPSHAQNLLSGGDTPLSLTMKDLGSGSWRRVRISGTGESKGSGGGILDMFGAMMGGAAGSAMSSVMGPMLSGVATAGENVFYTQGKTMTIGGETYLIAYQPQTKPIDLPTLMKMDNKDAPPIPKPLTADSALSLSLLNLRTAGSLMDIRTVDMKSEITASEEMVKTYEAMAKEEAEKKKESGTTGTFGDAGTESKSAETATPATPVENLTQLGQALRMYMNDNDMRMPLMMDADTLRGALTPYAPNEGAFVQPETKKAYLPNPILSSKTYAEVEKYATYMIAVYEDGPAADGTRGVVFVNGSTKRVTEAEWERLRKASKIE